MRASSSLLHYNSFGTSVGKRCHLLGCRAVDMMSAPVTSPGKRHATPTTSDVKLPPSRSLVRLVVASRRGTVFSSAAVVLRAALPASALPAAALQHHLPVGREEDPRAEEQQGKV